MGSKYTNSVGYTYEILTIPEYQALKDVSPLSYTPYDIADREAVLYNHATHKAVLVDTIEKCREALDMLLCPSLPQNPKKA